MILRQMRRNAIRIEGEQSAALELARGRLMLLGMFFIFAYMIVAVRAVDLGLMQGDMVRGDPNYISFSEAEDQKANTSLAQRGDIYDRNGVLLATTLKTASLYVDSKLITNPQNAAEKLVRILPDLAYDETLRAMKSGKRFVWLQRNITPQQQTRILEIGEPGLEFEYEDRRVYPQGNMAVHLLGYAGRDNAGLAGIERNFQNVLNAGHDLTLTVDTRLQHILRREIERAMTDFNGVGGAGVIMDVNSGDVLAGVSLPDFDPNVAATAGKDAMFNRVTLGVYELGSIFKIFSTAALFETRHVPMSQSFDATQPLQVGRFKIEDYHAQKRVMTIPEIFMHSSNIGTAMMGQAVGTEALQNFYGDLGLLDPLMFDIKEVGKPMIPNPWRDISTLTASYGHGIATTPLQICTAAAAVVNGGFGVRPKLVKHEKEESYKSDVRVLSQETSDKMRALMRLVVTQGTGKEADVPGYYVGGKTGTAEKASARGYDKDKLISSFVAVFPMDKPRYVILVMVDEPKGNKKSYGYATAGWVAAPAAARIITAMSAVLGLPAAQHDSANDISASLQPYIQQEEKSEKKLASF